MITKEQIEQAAYAAGKKICPGYEYEFSRGADWAAEQMEVENTRLREAIEGAITDLLAGKSRHGVREQLQKALAK